jgi:hypothetical protein
MCKQAICPECGKPVGREMPGAKVYHTPCLMEAMRPMRERDMQDMLERSKR